MNPLEYKLLREEPAALLQGRGASAKSIEVDLRKGLKSSSSQEPSAPGTPGKLFKSSVFKNADSSNLERPLVEGNKDHLVSQAKSELMRQEHQVGSGLSNNCINPQPDAYAQRL